MTTIIVTGMHRSGTSMVAGILKLCGVYFGDNLLHPQQENPKGFFEDLEFLEINKEILACSGGSWFEPPNELKINQNIKEKIKIFTIGAVLPILGTLWSILFVMSKSHLQRFSGYRL